MRLSIVLFEHIHDLIAFPFRTSLPVESGAHTVDNTHQVMKQVFFIIFCDIHHFYRSSLSLHEYFDITEPESGKPILMLNDQSGDGLILEQGQQLWRGLQKH